MSTRPSALTTAIALLLTASILPAAVAPALATSGASVSTGGPTANATALSTQPAEITVWTAPKAAFAALDDREAVLTAVRNGSLTRTDTVAAGDVVVFAVPASGAFGALEYEDGPNEPHADAFVDLVTSGDGFRFHLNQTNPAPNLGRARLDLAATNENDGLRVIPDERNGTLYVAIRTDRMVVDRIDRTGLRARPGQAYEANFTIAESVGLSGGRRTAIGTVEVAERTATIDPDTADALQWSSTGCQILTGQSSVAPGTELTVRVRSDDPGLSGSRTVTVRPDGEFVAGFVVESVPSNTTFTATVRGFPDGERRGVVGPDAQFASVELVDQSSDRRTVTIGSTTLSSGGFVVLYPEAAVADRLNRSASGCPSPSFHTGPALEASLGSSGYLTAGQSTNVSVRLDDPLREARTLVAVPFVDSNGNRQLDPENGDRPATANGSVVTDAAVVSLAAPDTTPATTDGPTTTTDGPTTTTDRPTTLPSTTTTPTTTTPTTTTPTTTTPTTTTLPGTPTEATPTATTTDGSGFGPLAALLALAALATLVRRR